MKSQIIHETKEQREFLESLGYTEGIYECGCGSCDPEPCMEMEVDTRDLERWEEINVFSHPSFDG